MASSDDTEGKILEAIDRHLRVLAEREDGKVGGTYLPGEILKLAEAFAWLRYPNQSHGGSVTQKAS